MINHLDLQRLGDYVVTKPLRVEYAGAFYPAASCGDKRLALQPEFALLKPFLRIQRKLRDEKGYIEK